MSNRGVSYAVANTVNPGNAADRVENWVELINVESTNRKFRVKLYDESGEVAKDYGWVRVKPYGEWDLAAGHETGLGQFLVEVTPEDADGEYYASLSRYIKDAAGEKYVAAVHSDFSVGAGTRRYLPVADESTGCRKLYLEMANPLRSSVKTLVKVRSASGKILNNSGKGQRENIKSLRQRHLDLSTLVPGGLSGVVEVLPNKKEGLLAQLVSYETDCSSGEVISAYNTKAQEPGEKVQRGSYTRYLGTDNFLEVTNTKSYKIPVLIESYSATGTRLKRRSGNLEGNDTKVYNLSESSTWKTTPDTYGHVKVTSGAGEQFIARLLRAKSLSSTPEFSYSTPVR